ncbi:hypothetical protein FocTR4_00013333 [Fusarium oxysporum f. sp. cubense]|uniref:Uncharacterized protein n=1 Tax=Fusarium oxysporum f. sp. cubense TaxID=61366 RepID=A0A5C6SJZ3_FUSOC|nr:hypothetical protein FocTR4_00013333 [Fusarium oxysporum f. sp. cubense]
MPASKLSTYIDLSDGNAIVAMGVAHFKDPSISITPERSILVSHLEGFGSTWANITVVPTNDTKVSDIDPSR